MTLIQLLSKELVWFRFRVPEGGHEQGTSGTFLTSRGDSALKHPGLRSVPGDGPGARDTPRRAEADAGSSAAGGHSAELRVRQIQGA